MPTNTYYSDQSHKTICPYCANETDHNADYLTWEDGEESEVQCGKCDQEFVQTAIVQIHRKSATLESFLRNRIRNLEKNIELNEPRRSEVASNVLLLLEQWNKELKEKKGRLAALSAEKADAADPYRDY